MTKDAQTPAADRPYCHVQAASHQDSLICAEQSDSSPNSDLFPTGQIDSIVNAVVARRPYGLLELLRDIDYHFCFQI